MSGDEIVKVEASDVEERIRQELVANQAQASGRFRKLLLAAMGAIPWVGSLIAGIGMIRAQERAEKVDSLEHEWLEEHSRRFTQLGETLAGITCRLEQIGPQTQERIESPGYLALVRTAFRVWDRADTSEKRDYIRKLLANAGATKVGEDDLLRLFIEWIDRYHEAHFQVIRVIYQYPGSTRAEMWDQIHGTPVREDSAEADLFKLLIRDLSTGSVLRQRRATDAAGRFLRKPPTRTPKGAASPFMKSAFDDKEQYVLTELGEKFVHYVMDELVPRIPGTPRAT